MVEARNKLEIRGRNPISIERSPVLLTVLVALLLPGPAHAYMDPASSGFLMQLLAPVLIAIGVLRDRILLLVRLAASKVAVLFRGKEG